MDPEAKPTDTSELSGCKLLIDASFLSILNPKGVYVERVYGCTDFKGPGVSSSIITDPDAGPQPVYAAQGFDVPEGMKAGKSYQLSHAVQRVRKAVAVAAVFGRHRAASTNPARTTQRPSNTPGLAPASA